MTTVSRLPQGTYTIQVRSGRHAGAEISLNSGTYLLGAGSNADIVLTDDGVAPGHVELRFDGEFCRFWSLDGAISVRNRQLGPGARGEAKLPADLTVAGVELTLSPPALSRVKPRPWRQRLLIGGGGAVVILGGGLALVLSGSVPAFSTPALVSAVISDAAQPKAAAVTDIAKASVRGTDGVASVPADGGDAAAAARALVGRLEKAGLAGRIAVQASGTVVEASGTLSPDRKKDWLDAQMWFDETYKGRLLLMQQVGVEAGAASPQLAIQAIWAGAGPYVIGGDGEKYGEGAMLPGGWRVEQIAREQVIVSRGAERVSLIP